MACAVKARIGTWMLLACSRFRITSVGRPSIHLRHLHVHEHDVEAILFQRLHAPRARSTPWLILCPRFSSSRLQASGLSDCLRPAESISWRRLPDVRCLAGEGFGRRRGTESARAPIPAARRGIPVWSHDRRFPVAGSAARRRCRSAELNIMTTGGRNPPVVQDLLRQREAIHARHLRVQNRQLEGASLCLPVRAVNPAPPGPTRWSPRSSLQPAAFSG